LKHSLDYYLDKFIEKTGYFYLKNKIFITKFDEEHGFISCVLDEENNVKLEFMCGDYHYLIDYLIDFATKNHSIKIYAYTSHDPKILKRSFKYKGNNDMNLIDLHGYKISIEETKKQEIKTRKPIYKVVMYLK
jgi:hypothetical protein